MSAVGWQQGRADRAGARRGACLAARLLPSRDGAAFVSIATLQVSNLQLSIWFEAGTVVRTVEMPNPSCRLKWASSQGRMA